MVVEGDVLAQHHPDDVGGVQGVERLGGDLLAVAQDGHAVGEVEDLIKEVGDEDDCKALGFQAADDVEQALNLVAVKAGGGFIQDEDLARKLHRAGDGDDLLDGDGVFGQLGADVDVKAVAGEEVLRGRVDALAVDHAEVGGLAAEEEVLGDRAVGEEVDLLVDGADAVGLAVQGVAESDRCAVEEEFPAVGLVGAGQDLDQGGFARAVFAEEGVDLACVGGEIHGVQRTVLAEDLDDPARLQDWFLVCHSVPSLPP